MFRRIMNHDLLTFACSFTLHTFHFALLILLQHHLLPDYCLPKEEPKPVASYVPFNG